jgi:hypothetical protein
MHIPRAWHPGGVRSVNDKVGARGRCALAPRPPLLYVDGVRLLSSSSSFSSSSPPAPSYAAPPQPPLLILLLNLLLPPLLLLLR